MLDGRELILHVGAHKTASSFLQIMLREHAPELRRSGLTAVHRAEIMKSSFYENIASILDGRGPIDAGKAKVSLGFLFKNKKKHILFSNEDMLCRIDKSEFFPRSKECMKFIREVTGDGTIRTILFTRSQPDYIESIFMQFMHLGRTFGFDEFLKRYRNVDLSWKRVLDDMASVIGQENVTAIPYESIKRIGSQAFFQHFLAKCGVTQPETFEVPEAKSLSRGANRSYSGEALKIARAINPLLDDADKPKLRKFLQENYSTATHAKAELFTPEQREAMIGEYADSNMEIFETYMPDWQEERRFYVPS